jgi:hypothetical protein
VKHLVPEARSDELPQFQAHLSHPVGWPAGPVAILLGGSRGLGDDHPSPLAQERRAALGDHGRGTEGPHHHPVEPPPVLRITPAHFGSLVDHGDPFPEATAPDRSMEELGTALVGVQEDQGGGRPADGDHQSGQPASRAQVEDVGGPGPRWHRLAAGQINESGGVLEVGLDRPRPQEAGATSVKEDVVQGSGGGDRMVGVGHRACVSP